MQAGIAEELPSGNCWSAALDQDAIHRLIIDRAEIGIYHTVLGGRAIWVNGAFAAMFGYNSPEQMLAEVGDRLETIIVDPQHRTQISAQLKQAGRVSNVVAEMRRRDGSRFWISESASILAAPTGETQIVGTIVDVSALVVSQQALKDAEQRFRSIFDNAFEGIYLSSLDGKMLNANIALARINGYETTEDLVSSVGDIALEWYVDPNRRQAFVDLIARDGRVTNFESEVYRHKTRERIWISENARLVRDEAGQPLFYEGTVQDITQRKGFERQLMLAHSAAEASNRAKSEFLAKMSHELRTPLNAIMGFSELIALTTKPMPELGKIHEYAGDILFSARYLYELITEILDYSKIDSGTVRLDERLVNVPALCRQCTHIVSERASRGAVSLRVVADEHLPMIRADERRLQQVLINLITNAVKFTPPGGNVRVAIDPAQDGGIVIVVADTGIGIPAKDLERIFEPFVQINRSALHHQEGTGLGLSICKSLVEMHQGRIEVSSSPGRGTTVRVVLPKARISAPAEQA